MNRSISTSSKVVGGELLEVERLFIKNKWTKWDQRELKSIPSNQQKSFPKKDVNNYQKKIESELLNDYKKGDVCNLLFFYNLLRNCECKDK